MPVVRLYLHGVTAGVPPRKNDHERVPRGDVEGWSEGATRRNVRFLYSIETPELDGSGYAFTLTVRDCPPTAREWHRLRRAFVKRMERAGMSRLHWVVEWQRRGVPHLHGVVYFHEGCKFRRPTVAIEDAWVAVAEKYGALLFGQHAKPLGGVVGWFEYLSKHAARGVSHYQRAAENVPDGWKSKTGRVWGHVGDWPRREAVRLSVSGSEGDGGYYAFRRLVRSWRLADARSDPVKQKRAGRVASARAMLRCSDRALSSVRGVSEWIPQDLTLAMLSNLATRGYSVTC